MSLPIYQPPGLGDYVFEARGWRNRLRLVSGFIEGSLWTGLGYVLFVRTSHGELVACTADRVAVNVSRLGKSPWAVFV